MTRYRAPLGALGLSILILGGAQPSRGQPPEPSGPGQAETTATVTPETAPVVIRELARLIRIEEDGRLTDTLRMKAAIREQSALQPWGQLAFPYLSAYESVSLQRLVVQKPDGSRVEADLATLEDAPPPESGTFEAPAYNDTRIKQITVPSLAVGDTVAYEVVRSRHTPFLAGHFWGDHTFQDGVIVEREVLELDHPERMHVAVKRRIGFEPESTDVREAGRRRRTFTHQVREVREPGKAEAFDRMAKALRGRGDAPDIQVSTFQTWDQVASWYASLSGPSERATERVRARAAEISRAESAERLKGLHQAVARGVRYVSLAFGEGRYKPRPAELTLSSAYGDCKDKHALLAALGAELGFSIRPVLLNSSRELDVDFPSPGQFDHVISLITTPDGRQTWMDATLDVARPGTLFRTLRGKEALLVAASGSAEIVRTPAELPQAIKVDVAGTHEADGRYHVAVRRELSGDIEIAMRSMLKSVPQHGRLEIAKGMAKEDGLGEATVKSVTMSEPLDVDQPLWIRYEAEHHYSSPLKRERWSYWVPGPQLVSLPADEGQTLELGPRTEIELTTRFVLPNVLSISPPVGVSVVDEVARYESSYSAGQGVLTARRRFENFVERVDRGRSAGLRALEKSARADRDQKFAVDAAPANALTAVESGDLVAEGERALEHGDSTLAVAKLKQATAAKSDHQRAWNSLGRALHASGRWDEAIEAYDRQIALNRFDEHAYRNRGLAHWQAGRLKEAEASMLEQIAVTPLNAAAFTSLGGIRIQAKREAEAIEPLRKAVSLAESDPWPHLELARALAATGASADALASFERVVAVAPNPTMWNNAAWYMAEHDLALDRAYEYAQSAVAASAAATLLFSPDRPAGPQLAATGALAAHWDTLGWVQFKRGRRDAALKYVKASWQVRQEAIVGEHLGRIYEGLGRPRDAFVAYRIALGLPRAGDFVAARARELATSLTPPPKTADSATLGSQMRTVPLKGFPPVPGPLEFVAVSDRTGAITSAKAVTTGTDAPAAQALIGVRLPVEAPDDVPFRLTVRGVVSCRDGRAPCWLVLFRPDEAVKRSMADSPAQQSQ